ncbi:MULTISPECIES: transcription antitermination factor NusB [unclassified Wenzhouxiangella]|uniref:transcription antitermination factor NusB n=1 Tax=unclassified Wenzhouxiangella TaxID=2613841 RepID=UPI000E326C50|nr:MULTISPECIES: transcription antitermination factor NusB [unclassified Wenzhouxiangella]RFF26427.1 transcription antitermination factor NusB [Wenzhouxiangella sp. 15181]RFP67300.1 transcription antitermination factor NusB [Wenzhouxiangella sp. 15190]
MSRRRTVSPFEPRRRARRRALQALYQWQINDDSAAAIIDQFREEQNFEGVDEDYFETLVREVVANREALDEALGPHVSRVDASLDQMERVILRLGACELLHHPETPYRVIIDEAVELAHRFGAEQAHTFVNGVLDHLSRDARSTERERAGGDG